MNPPTEVSSRGGLSAPSTPSAPSAPSASSQVSVSNSASVSSTTESYDSPYRVVINPDTKQPIVKPSKSPYRSVINPQTKPNLGLNKNNKDL